MLKNDMCNSINVKTLFSISLSRDTATLSYPKARPDHQQGNLFLKIWYASASETDVLPIWHNVIRYLAIEEQKIEIYPFIGYKYTLPVKSSE